MEGFFSPTHILILLAGGLCFAAVLAGVVLLVVLLTRRQKPLSHRQASLEAENERLRDDIAKLKKTKE